MTNSDFNHSILCSYYLHCITTLPTPLVGIFNIIGVRPITITIVITFAPYISLYYYLLKNQLLFNNICIDDCIKKEKKKKKRKRKREKEKKRKREKEKERKI
jgi:hypothetical protein